MIKSVKGSTQIQQHENSIVSSINHYQQIVKYAKEGCLSAMTTSVRRLKLDMQTVCVEVFLQLVGNRSLKETWTNRVGWTRDGRYRGPRGQDLAFLSIV